MRRVDLVVIPDPGSRPFQIRGIRDSPVDVTESGGMTTQYQDTTRRGQVSVTIIVGMEKRGESCKKQGGDGRWTARKYGQWRWGKRREAASSAGETGAKAAG